MPADGLRYSRLGYLLFYFISFGLSSSLRPPAVSGLEACRDEDEFRNEWRRRKVGICWTTVCCTVCMYCVECRIVIFSHAIQGAFFHFIPSHPILSHFFTLRRGMGLRARCTEHNYQRSESSYPPILHRSSTFLFAIIKVID